ncbi:unnamed protein product [Adineta steineri]|uniref:NHL repeat containing protein n=1 Tax=Adineta steineri TaxID=433720 RepID=A0A819R7Q9_9BILA|nr:unnamed protein product [Adineta steineri]CAF4035287.1 unnamed protein product [Adineta steineri]
MFNDLMDTLSKQLWLKSIWLFVFLFEQSAALNICPMSNWSINATTVAGSPTGISGSNASLLSTPSDVFIGNNSMIYVLDSSNFRVQLWLRNAVVGTTIIQGSAGSALNQFGLMAQMSIDINGNIYILDSNNTRVTKWVPGAGTSSIVAAGNGKGSNANQINGAVGMYVQTSTSIIWIADTGNNRIVKWSSPSTSTIVCGTYGSGATQFSSPTGIFIDENDQNTMYVADTGNQRIQQWRSGDTSGTTVAGLNQLFLPSRVIVDINKNMFIVDTGNSRVVRWTIGSSSGTVIAGNSVEGILPNQLNFPTVSTTTTTSTSFVQSSTSNAAVIGSFYQKSFAMLLLALIIY